jgi:DNA-binding winged helix-turn-helix (wHTH) protein
VSSGKVAVATQLLSRPGPPERLDAELGHPWDERVPPPGRDATLLAVVPIPGTGTSLAIVGYAIDTSGGQPRRPEDQGGTSPAGTSPAGTSPAGTSKANVLLDHVQRRVWAGGREIELTFQEFELLAFLSTHPATVFSRADLVEQVWHRGPGPDGRPVKQDSRTVDVHISRVRQKLGPFYGQCLVTEYRVGYQFRPPGTVTHPLAP